MGDDNMITLNISSAMERLRHLNGNAKTLRHSLSTASKAEQSGTPGATETRLKLTAKFGLDASKFEADLADTLATAESFDRADTILRRRISTSAAPAGSPEAHAARAVRAGMSGARLDALALTCSDAAAQGRAAHMRAERRFGEVTDNLKATAALAQLCAESARNGWDQNHPAVQRAKTAYKHHSNQHRRRKRHSDRLTSKDERTTA